MWEHYFDAPSRLEQLRCCGAGAHIEGFSGSLKERGYSRRTARSYLLTAAHLVCFLQNNQVNLESLDHQVLEQFGQHLPHCHCRKPRGGLGKKVSNGVRAFLEYLRGLGALRVDQGHEIKASPPPLVELFRHWLKQHCGAAESTLRLYSHGAAQLVTTVGDDPSQYDAQTLRAFVLERARRSGIGATKALIQALRSFLRYLATEGKCSAGLEQAIPTVAGWRLSSLPRYLSSSELERTIDSCDAHTPQGARDRAILLLLARLGLRAGDVAGLRLCDFDWKDATILVSGKSRWEARLPLPQEVGDAVLQYLEYRQPLDTERVFLRTRAPWRPLSSAGASAIARRAMRRAAVSAPSYGAHILRHTAATHMLRQGVPLDEIRTLLRHRSVDMTATYAKVDIDLLRRVAQPWSEVLRCS